MKRPRGLPLAVAICTALMLVLGQVLWACQVPVFRYALERWSADRYQVLVLHAGDLDPEAKQALQLLRQAEQERSIDVKVVDMTTQVNMNDDRLKALWTAEPKDPRPQLLAFYPLANEVGRIEPMYRDVLTRDSVRSVLDSPVRRHLAQRFERGDSAVWIFVPSGKEQADEAALVRLQNQLKADADWLELPSAAELEVEPEVLKTCKVPLKIEFSILSVSRTDPAERFLLQSLLNSEDDLAEFNEPLAFPVFGQGRVLYGLVGNGIAEDTIRTASSFMAGPCSCQVKNQNPGFDLLIRANWKQVLGEILISEPIELPNSEALQPKLLTIPPGRKKSG